jgi:hypothetical protein
MRAFFFVSVCIGGYVTYRVLEVLPVGEQPLPALNGHRDGNLFELLHRKLADRVEKRTIDT